MGNVPENYHTADDIDPEHSLEEHLNAVHNKRLNNLMGMSTSEQRLLHRREHQAMDRERLLAIVRDQEALVEGSGQVGELIVFLAQRGYDQAALEADVADFFQKQNGCRRCKNCRCD